MEINERFVTILTPEGEFLRARKLGGDYQIGQEIDYISDVQVKRNTFFSYIHTFKGKALAASFVCLLLLVSVIPFYQNNQVYAYMSIDINPSIELGLNKHYQVVELIPYNDDGKKIVNQLRGWKKKEIDEVTDNILNEIKSQGFLKKNHEIVVGTVYKAETIEVDDPQWIEKWTNVKKVIQREHLELTVVEGTTKEREYAQKKGMTVGEYKDELMKVNKKQTKTKQDQTAQPIKEEVPKVEQPPVVESSKEEEQQVEGVSPNLAEHPAASQKNGEVQPAKESSSKLPPGQAKKENNLDQPAVNEKEKGQGNAQPPGIGKKTEQTEINADNNQQKNNGNKGNNGNNGNNNNGQNSNQDKQKDSSKS